MSEPVDIPIPDPIPDSLPEILQMPTSEAKQLAMWAEAEQRGETRLFSLGEPDD